MPFIRFLLTRICLTTAIQIQSVAVGWQVFDLTQDPLYLGYIGLAEALPSLSVALLAGYISDHYNKKTVALVSQLITLFSVSWLIIFTHLDLSVDAKVMGLFFSMFLNGLGRGFFSPSMASIFGQVVPKEHYVRAATWNTGGWQFAAIIGPVMAGFLFNSMGVGFTYWIEFGLIVLSILALAPMQGQFVNQHPLKLKLKASIQEGLDFVFNNKIILGAMSLDLFAVLFGGAVALLPVFAKDILAVGPSGLGWLRAAPSIGSALMIMAMLFLPPIKKAGKILLFVVSGFGLCMIGFALSENYYLSLLMLALSGAFDNVSVVIRNTFVQTLVPPMMKGRVSAVNSIFIGSSNEIGAFESGTAAKLMGTVPSVVFGGGMTLLVALITKWKFKELVEYEF
jgi:MFS family permease